MEHVLIMPMNYLETKPVFREDIWESTSQNLKTKNIFALEKHQKDNNYCLFYNLRE